MDINLNKEVTAQCPKCNGQIKYKLKQVGSSVLCPSCKSNIFLSSDGFKNFSDLKNIIKKTFK